MTEAVTQDAEGAGGVAEAVGDFGRGELVDEEGTESFVLSLEGRERGQKETSFRAER
jgi:hypothetical protein